MLGYKILLSSTVGLRVRVDPVSLVNALLKFTATTFMVTATWVSASCELSSHARSSWSSVLHSTSRTAAVRSCGHLTFFCWSWKTCCSNWPGPQDAKQTPRYQGSHTGGKDGCSCFAKSQECLADWTTPLISVSLSSS